MRDERDKAIEDIMWRIQRHESETRLGLDPTDDISSLDNYIQQLRDMTKQAGFPTDVKWPVLTV
nr:phage tail assembly chaperone [Pseudodesulfovibrio sp.]